MSKRIVVSGRWPYRGLISDDEYDETDWGSSVSDKIQFEIEGGPRLYMTLSTIGSLNFGYASSPAPGSYDVWRVSAVGDYGGADCLVDAENLTLLKNAIRDEDEIATFETVYGIEIRLMIPNINRIEVKTASLDIEE